MLLPKWLKVQRISLALFTVSGVLLLVYALGYLSNAYIFYAYGDDRLYEFYTTLQGINTGLLFKAVMAIVFALFLFVLQLNKHPPGRYTLILVSLICAVSIFFSVHSVLNLLAVRQEYVLLDLTVLDRYIEFGSITYSYSTVVFDLGFVGYVLFSVSALFVVAVVARNAFKVPAGGGKLC
jgi:hypothetical protein